MKLNFDSEKPSKDEERLQWLIRRSQAIRDIETNIFYVLPEQARAQCQLANVRDQSLIIHTTNASWLTHIKPYRDDLIHAAQKCQVRCHDVVFRVRPRPRKPTNHETHRVLNPETLKLIENLNQWLKNT